MLNVQGQSRAISQLQRAIASGRLAGTWIFSGPAGVGKFTLAIQLAKTILCDSPRQQPNGKLETPLPQLSPDFQITLPCGVCESCKAVDGPGGGNHPDLHIITKELIRYHDKSGTSKGTTLSIHVIRGEITGDPAENKEAKIYKRSFRGKGKFFLIDEADLMETPAQNALLKTLEEPPASGGGSFLILVTTSPQELLPTIRSRSQTVEFNALPDAVITHAMIGAGLSRDDAALMARLSRGSLGRALRWAEDIRTIEQKNTAALERAAKKAKSADAKTPDVKATDDSDGDEDAPAASKFTTGGILAWTRELATQLDQLVAGQSAASDVAAAISKFAAEYSGLQLLRDKLTSGDRAKRDGIGLFMSIAAEWFSDRLRHALGTPHPVPLPGQSGALDYGVVPKLIISARMAEAQIDINANDKILLAATTTQWEYLLHPDA